MLFMRVIHAVYENKHAIYEINACYL